jgi:hypothetical protein
MLPTLRCHATAQSGLFARHQALTSGYSCKAFEQLTRRGGPWVKVRYGVYTERAPWEEMDGLTRRCLVDRAGLLVCDLGTVLSHASAARAHRLPLYAADDGLVHVTRLRFHDRRLTRIVAGIKHHSGLLADEDIVEVDGVRVTSPARTVLDVTAEFGYLSGLVVADAVLRSGVPREALQATVDRQPHHPHVMTRRMVVAEADGRAETPIETLGRHVVKQMGISDVQPQQTVDLPDGSRAVVDLYSARLRHVFECDGKLKYRDQLDLRGKPMTARDVLVAEKRREDRLRGLNFGVSRMGWADVQPDAFARVSARVSLEIRSQDAAGLFSSARRGD